MLLLPSLAFGSDYTINQDGINSKALGLTGAGVKIGQVEIGGRAAKHGVDPPTQTNSQVVPAVIYGPSTTDHATFVASVMISTGAVHPVTEGVAPQAVLHTNSYSTGFSPDDNVSIAMNILANVDGMRAINLSVGRELQEFDPPDGNSHFAKFVDWSSRDDDVLYITGGTQAGQPDYSTPSDNYNGMTIAISQSLDAEMTDPVYRQVGFGNTTIGDAGGPFDERVSVDLLAPGWDIALAGPGNQVFFHDGTSLATPHVTGAVALLHEFVDKRMNTDHAHRHETMKSILLNSADKIAGVHGSKRNVLTTAGGDFRTTVAYNDFFTALDIEMGAGHLNTMSALINLRAGEQEPGAVNRIGWDYGTLGLPGNLEVYFLDKPLEVGTWVTITAAWDRFVDNEGLYDDYSAG
jgi:hypothetical protein